jgi:hypothetical protein
VGRGKDQKIKKGGTKAKGGLDCILTSNKLFFAFFLLIPP